MDQPETLILQLLRSCQDPLTFEQMIALSVIMGEGLLDRFPKLRFVFLESGCGWLPYKFVEQRLAVDFWTLLRPSWLASGEFERPAE